MPASADRRAIARMFDKYKEKDKGEVIDPDGLERLYVDLEVDPDDVATTLFAWQMGATRLCEFTREEFTENLSRLGLDSPAKLKKFIESLRATLKHERHFRSFYIWCFGYYKLSTQRGLDIESAKVLWSQVMANKYKHLPLWLEFLGGKTQSISKDTYTMFYDFTREIADDFSNHDENAAWPLLIDEFVEFARRKLDIAPPPPSQPVQDYSSSYYY